MRYPIDRLDQTPPGRVKKVKVEDFTDVSAFPTAWMSATGTASIAASGTTIGYAQVSTSGADGNSAFIQSERPVALAAIEAILFEVEGYQLVEHYPVADILLTIRQEGATPGVYAIQRSTETFVRLGISGDTPGTETPTFFDIRGGIQAANNTPKNFGLFLQCRTKELLLLDGDRRVLGYRDLAAGFAVPTNVKPRLLITAREAAVKTVRVKQVRQTWWVN